MHTSPPSIPSTPSWVGELTRIVHHVPRQGARASMEEPVLCARRRFGRDEVIDVLAVLFGSAVRSERTLAAFSERLKPWAGAFLARFGRDRLPARSTCRRVLAALDQAAVEALRPVCLHDVLARPLGKEEQPGGRWDRLGNHVFVFDSDGTREAARPRALPVTADRPAPVRRVRPRCAPGSTGRTRGHDGKGVVRSDRAGLPFVLRGTDAHLLTHPEVQTRLHVLPDQHRTPPESGIIRARSDGPGLTLGPTQEPCHVVGAIHPAPSGGTRRVGVTRDGVVDEVFSTRVPQHACSASDMVAWSLHRGACEPARAEEDLEQDPDHWCRQTASGCPAPALPPSSLPFSHTCVRLHEPVESAWFPLGEQRAHPSSAYRPDRYGLGREWKGHTISRTSALVGDVVDQNEPL